MTGPSTAPAARVGDVSRRLFSSLEQASALSARVSLLCARAAEARLNARTLRAEAVRRAQRMESAAGKRDTALRRP